MGGNIDLKKGNNTNERGSNMKINTGLSLNGCWKMVNAIQNGRTPQEIRERCAIAVDWLNANKVINFDEYDDLMMAVSYLYRESYHIA